MKYLILLTIAFSRLSFAFELKAGGELHFNEFEGSLTAQSGNSYFKYEAINRQSFAAGPGEQSEKKALLGLLLVNMNVASGKSVALPEKSQDIIPFLTKYAENAQATVCEKGANRNAFMSKIETLLAEVNEDKIAEAVMRDLKERPSPKMKTSPAAK